jgi:hypothetical protein
MGKIVCEMGRWHGKYNLDRLRFVFFFSILRISRFWREHSQQNKLRRARKFSGQTDAEGGGAGAENAGEGRFCLKDRYFWFASGWVDEKYGTRRHPNDRQTPFFVK